MKKWAVALGLAAVLGGPGLAGANHSWGGYHWARTVNPFTLKLGDNVTSGWDGYLATTSADWSKSSVLDTVIAAGGTSARRCRPTKGRVEVCNANYGSNGWLGLAQIWISGSHITQGITKVNDTYFNSAYYNTAAWKNMVMCQEVGHTLGLDHQDENFYNSNLGTCMDYTNDPASNQHPNQHDYDQLEEIYAHLDSFTTVQGAAVSSGAEVRGQSDEPGEWGRLVKEEGRTAIYERDFGGGEKMFTFVVWAQEREKGGN